MTDRILVIDRHGYDVSDICERLLADLPDIILTLGDTLSRFAMTAAGLLAAITPAAMWPIPAPRLRWWPEPRRRKPSATLLRQRRARRRRRHERRCGR